MRWTSIIWIVLCTSAVAEPGPYFSDEGHQYSFEANENGVVLTSLYPTARLVGFGAGRHLEIGIEIIYLGNDCDAFNEVFGSGSWGWANGGFAVTFQNTDIRFLGQELQFSGGMNCRI